jgi:(p)ppGpp synthase/HD superfamily hydrolase
MMPMLEQVISLAAMAHSGQLDKGGQPYILHPLRVMLSLQTEEERVVAVLHDIVEDTNWTLDALAINFPRSIVSAVDALTRRSEETYKAFIARAAQNELARRVKIADLKDNLDMRRIPHATLEDWDRAARYQAALSYLEDYPDEPTPAPSRKGSAP